MKAKRTIEIDAEELLKLLKEKLQLSGKDVKLKVSTSGGSGYDSGLVSLDKIVLEYEDGSSDRDTWDR